MSLRTGSSACEDHRIGSGDKGIRRQNHLAVRNTPEPQGNLERSGPGIHGDRVRDPDVGGEGLLEPMQEISLGQHATAENTGEVFEQDLDIVVWNAGSRLRQRQSGLRLMRL